MNPDLVAIQMKLFGGTKVAAETAAVRKEMEGVGTTATKSAKQQSAMRTAMTKQVSTMRMVGRGMTKYLTLPVVGVGVAAGAMAIDFEHEMHNVNSIAQLPQKQFERLNQQVLDLAGPVAQAPKTLAEGMYDLVSSGFDAHESLTILKSSALAASAGLTTSEVATKAVAASINAYQLKAKDAGHISDTLFETVNRGVLSFDDLASTIGDVLPFASQVGVNLNELGAAVSTMTKAGINPSETMTRLKNVMVTMLKPGKDLSSRLKELGTTGEEIVAKHGLQGAIELITKGMSKEQIAGLFPNIRALGGVLALTGSNAARAREDLAAFGNTAGATQKVLHEQEKSVAFQAQRAWAELQAGLIELGQVILPMVIPPFMHLTHAAIDAVKWFAKLPEPIRDVGLALLALLALAGPMTMFGASLLSLRVSMMALSATGAESGGMAALLGLGGKGAPIGKILGRLGIGAAGVTASQLGGKAIGGDLGDFVSKMGTGASLGFTVGGPMGAAVGGAAGAVASAIGKVKSEMKSLTNTQFRLQHSQEDVVAAWHDQRAASRGLVVANRRVDRSHDRARHTTEAMKKAQQHLTAVIQEYGSKSRPAIRAEARLTGLVHNHRKALKALERAERLRGVALSAYKTTTNETVLAERHRINVLTDVRDKQSRLYADAKRAAPQSERTQELAKSLLGTEGRLAKATQHHADTLADAAKKGGPAYARFLQHANQESIRAGGHLKVINSQVEGLTANLERLGEQNFNIPTPPHPHHRGRGHQAGGFISRSEFAMVGEAGPELVHLPGGSRVYPHGATPRGDGRVNRHQFGGAQSGGKTYLAPVILRVGRRKLAEVIAETQEDEAARQ